MSKLESYICPFMNCWSVQSAKYTILIVLRHLLSVSLLGQIQQFDKKSNVVSPSLLTEVSICIHKIRMKLRVMVCILSSLTQPDKQRQERRDRCTLTHWLSELWLSQAKSVGDRDKDWSIVCASPLSSCLQKQIVFHFTVYELYADIWGHN